MKTLEIEFVGGLWGGQTIRGDALNLEEAKLAKKCYWTTDGGAVGCHFSQLSAQEMRFLRQHAAADCDLDLGHEYIVAHRDETDDRIRVRFDLLQSKEEE